MQDFTAGAISATPNKTQTTGNAKTDELVKQIVCESGCTKSCDLVEEMIITALKMGRDQTTTAMRPAMTATEATPRETRWLRPSSPQRARSDLPKLFI